MAEESQAELGTVPYVRPEAALGHNNAPLAFTWIAKAEDSDSCRVVARHRQIGLAGVFTAGDGLV